MVTRCYEAAPEDVEPVDSDDPRIADIDTIQGALEDALEIAEESSCEAVDGTRGWQLRSSENWDEVEAALESIETRYIQHGGYVFAVALEYEG